MFLRNYVPHVSAELSAIVDDAKGLNLIEDANFNLPDNFIRPFIEEFDSRNEFKSKVSQLLN